MIELKPCPDRIDRYIDSPAVRHVIERRLLDANVRLDARDE